VPAQRRPRLAEDGLPGCDESYEAPARVACGTSSGSATSAIPAGPGALPSARTMRSGNCSGRGPGAARDRRRYPLPRPAPSPNRTAFAASTPSTPADCPAPRTRQPARAPRSTAFLVLSGTAAPRSGGATCERRAVARRYRQLPGIGANPRTLTEAGFPVLLQSSFEVCPHGRAHVPVDAVHAGHLVARPFGLQHLGDAILVQPCLVTVPQAVRCQAAEHREPRRQRYVRRRLLP
jgi:hypothetical protein